MKLLRSEKISKEETAIPVDTARIRPRQKVFPVIEGRSGNFAATRKMFKLSLEYGGYLT